MWLLLEGAERPKLTASMCHMRLCVRHAICYMMQAHTAKTAAGLGATAKKGALADLVPATIQTARVQTVNTHSLVQNPDNTGVLRLSVRVTHSGPLAAPLAPTYCGCYQHSCVPLVSQRQKGNAAVCAHAPTQYSPPHNRRAAEDITQVHVPFEACSYA